MNKKAQGALEYLLLIGGAVLVASIVIALITGTTGSVPDPAKQAACASHISCDECVADKDSGGACVAMFNDGAHKIAGASGTTCSPAEEVKYQYCRTRHDTTGAVLPSFTT